MKKKEPIKLVVWGTGGLATNTLSYNQAWLKAVDIVCFVSNSHKLGEEEIFDGKPVVAPEELVNIEWDYITIFSTYVDEIHEQIINELKLPEDRIVSLEELAQKVVEYNDVNIIGKDVLLYGENYNTDNYVYHIRKRVKSLRIITNGIEEKISGVKAMDINEIKHAEFDYILLLSLEDKVEEKLIKQIYDSGYDVESKILRLSQWSCNLALDYKLLRNTEGKFYYAIVGRPTWGLMALFTEFMRASAHATELGYIPFIDMKNSANMYLEEKKLGIENAWEYYFTQPKDAFGKNLEEIYENENVVIPSKFLRIKKNRNLVERKDTLENLRNIYHNNYKIQDCAMEKIFPEYQRVFGKLSEENVLGVIYRGTDYKNINPANHYIQPDLEEYIDICKKYMKKWKCERIFIATEDADALEVFKGEFKEKLLFINQLRYNNTGDKFLFQINNKRKDDKYLRGIEYLTALYCLTQCDYLVSGRHGGLNGVLVLKEEAYQEVYIFNKGKYANNNKRFS